jgi:hypothetical protein
MLLYGMPNAYPTTSMSGRTEQAIERNQNREDDGGGEYVVPSATAVTACEKMEAIAGFYDSGRLG